jgi:hypothetical protein
MLIILKWAVETADFAEIDRREKGVFVHPQGAMQLYAAIS